MCFKKKNTSKKINENREKVESNAKKIGILMALNGYEELHDKLLVLKDKLQFMTPSILSKVDSLDTKIKHALDDLKILLNKNEKQSNLEKAMEQIKDIEVLIAERNSLI